MKTKWPLLSLREVNISLIDCDHRTPPTTETGYPYVTIPQLKDGRLEISQSRRISYEHYLEWTRKAKPVAYDVVLSRRCNPGESAFVAPDIDFALGQNLVLLHSDGSKVFPPFLRWIVRGPEWWEQVNIYRNPGAVFDSLKCRDIPNFKLHIPSFPEQQQIATILSSLDDKIELNRRMNHTLEQVAQTLFRQWFTIFDFPNIIDQPYHSSGGKMVESELGEIPEGWRAGKTQDAFTTVGGGTPSTSNPDFWEGGDIPWTTPKDLTGVATPVMLDPERRITAAGLAKISSGLLPAGTLLLSSRAPIGYLAITQLPVAINQGYIALNPKAHLSNLYMLLWLKQYMEVVKGRANGTTFQEISKGSFREIPMVLPDAETARRFDQIVQPLFSRMVTNEIQSRTLTAIRDTLLPQLLSGHLTVNQAEELLA